MVIGRKEIAILKMSALVPVAICLITSAVLPFQLILAEPSEENGADGSATEPPTQVADEIGEQGTLNVRAEYTNKTKEIFGIEVLILSGNTTLQTGLTPVNFTLPVGQVFTVVAKSKDSTFFSGWEDNKFGKMARDVTIGQIDSLTALFRDIPGARLISVNASASVLDSDGTPYQISLADSSMQYAKAGRAIIDSGRSPKTYELADGQMYKITASRSSDPVAENFKISYWIDPVTGEKVFNETMVFEARDGLELHAFYEQDDPANDVVFLDSRLDNGTAIKNVYVKILKTNEPPSVGPAAQGFTPDTFSLRTDEEYAAVASEVCGFCLVKSIVFDHWEATGGPFMSPKVLADEYHFRTGGVASRIDHLVAVYRIVPDDDFAAVKINETGSDINVEIPSEVNGGIALEFTEVVDTGNLTAAEISVTVEWEIFDGVSDDGIANMTVFETLSNGTSVPKVFSSKGPVVRMNDGNLALAGETNVTLRFDPTEIPEGVNSTMLHVLHFNGTNWEDVTQVANATDNTKTGMVDSFSPFVIAWESKFGIGGVGPSVEGHHGGGGGSAAVVTGEQPEQEPISILALAAGATSGGSIELAPLGNNDTIDVMLENVTSTGKITVAKANSDLMDGYVNAAEPLVLQGSDFMVLESIYNLTADSKLAFTGPIEVSIPYNQTAIDGLLGANINEGAVRLVYYDGNSWQDATTGINETTNKVTAKLQSLGSPILLTAAVVNDGTFGPAYFDSNPQSKVVLENTGLSRDVTIDGVDPSAEPTDCSQDTAGQGGCLVTLAGSIRNAQRVSQNYSIIVQTTDANRVVYDIEIFSSSLERGEKQDVDVVWSLDSVDSSAQYVIQVFVLNDLDEDTNLIGEVLKFDLEL